MLWADTINTFEKETITIFGKVSGIYSNIEKILARVVWGTWQEIKENIHVLNWIHFLQGYICGIEIQFDYNIYTYSICHA